MGGSKGLGNISICKDCDDSSAERELFAEQRGGRYCVAVILGGRRALMYHG